MEESKINSFKRLLELIEENDENYDVRNSMVISLIRKAKVLGFECGYRLDENETDHENPEFPVLCVSLPVVGQISWHTPSTYANKAILQEIGLYNKTWDGHDTTEKYKRIHEFIDIPYG